MSRPGFFYLVVLFSFVWAGTAFAACAPNSSVSSEKAGVVHCKCNAGYENRGGECRPIVVMRAKPEPSMRAMSRSECLKFQDGIRRDGFAGCRSNLYYCMIEQGSGFPAAWCAVGAALSVWKPSVTTVVGAIAKCGEKAQAVYASCEPKLAACSNAVAASYPAGMASCPSQ